MFNCRLTKNISLSQNEDETGCGSLEMSVGGIDGRFYLYNIDDVQGFAFKNDNRSDDSLFIDTIITGAPYYYVDATSITYNEEQDGNTYTHTLTATVGNINPVTQDILSDAAPGKYLVCFKPLGSEHLRCFGWKEGSAMRHTMDLSEDTSNYTLKFEDESEYPLFTVDKSNFNLKDKQFDPIWQPLYDVKYCELDERGRQTGWCLAQYVVKVNSAGSALGADNKLIEYTGLKQDAYKLKGVPDGDYHIISTYTQDAVFDGKPVRVFNPDICLPEADGTISWASETVRLNSTTRQTASVRLTSNAPWTITSETPEHCSLAPNSGETSADIQFYFDRYGGDDTVTARNLNSYEETSINVQNRTIICNSGEELENGAFGFNAYCRAYGSSENWTWSVDNPGLNITVAHQTDGDKTVPVGLDCDIIDKAVEEERTWTFTFTHADDDEEVKTAVFKVLGRDTNPYWRLLSRYCETTKKSGK